MAAKREIGSLEEHKRELLARGEAYRQALGFQVKEFQSSIAWVPRSVERIRSFGPILAVAAPIVGFFFARKKLADKAIQKSHEKQSRKGLFATAMMGFQLYNRVRPLLSAFAQKPTRRSPQNHR